MPYGNSQPPEGAPVPRQELIGAALFLGLVSVVSISTHGAYLIALPLGRVSFAPSLLLLILLNVAGFAASLWLLALRRWAWHLAIGYAVVEVGLRAYYAAAYLVPSLAGRSAVDLPGAAGEAALTVVFLVVLAYLLGEETRAMLNDRDRYRAGVEG